MSRPVVAVVAFSDLASDPRVDRQIRALRDDFQVVAIGAKPPRHEAVTFLPVSFQAKSLPRKVLAAMQLLLGRFEAHYRQLAHVRELTERLAEVRADVIVANDIDTLPAVLRHARGARVLFDAHEYAPRQFEDRLVFRLFFQRYRAHQVARYVPLADAMMTVGPSIAEAYERDTGLRPVVLTNAPEYVELSPRLRTADGRPIRLIHHGAAIRSRRLETMIRALDHLDDQFELDLMLVANDPRYKARLERLAGERPNVRFRPPVAMQDLPGVLNEYDVGIYHLEPASFNQRFALPNKIFEFIQGRIAVAVSPSPEMARLVRDTGCGVVAEDFTEAAFAAALRNLDHDKINAFKQRSHAAARELSSGRNEVRLRELVTELVTRGVREARPA